MYIIATLIALFMQKGYRLYVCSLCVGEIPEDILENCATTNIQNDNQTNRTPTTNELLTLKVKCLEKELDISNQKLTKYLGTEYKKNENTVSAHTDNGIWESYDALNIEHKEFNKKQYVQMEC